MLAGPGRLDKIDNYSHDGVHFKPEGYEKLFMYIQCTIVDIIGRKVADWKGNTRKTLV